MTVLRSCLQECRANEQEEGSTIWSYEVRSHAGINVNFRMPRPFEDSERSQS